MPLLVHYHGCKCLRSDDEESTTDDTRCGRPTPVRTQAVGNRSTVRDDSHAGYLSQLVRDDTTAAVLKQRSLDEQCVELSSQSVGVLAVSTMVSEPGKF